MTRKLTDLDTQDVIITSSNSSTKMIVVTPVSTFVPLSKISIACDISPGSSTVSKLTRKCCLEDNASVSAIHQLIGVVQ